MEEQQHITSENEIQIPPFYLRLITFIIDMVCLRIVSYFITEVIGLLLFLLTKALKYEIISDYYAFFILVNIIIIFIYYMYFELKYGRTIGKFVVKTKVIAAEGHNLNFKTIFLRTLCRFIPFEFVSYFKKNPVGLHDKLSNTLTVIQEKKADKQ